METELKNLLLYNHEEDYWDNYLINHSLVVDFENNGPQCLCNPIQKTNNGIVFGNILDTLVTEPSEFDKRYFVVDDVKIPNEKINMFLKEFALWSMKIKLMEIDNDSLVAEALNRDIFPGCKKRETILSKLSSYSDYFDILLNNKYKKVIPSSLYKSVLDCVNALHSSNMTSWIFDGRYETLYQTIMFSSLYGGVKCKFDILLIDSKNKKIIPVDIKYSSFPESQFIQQVFYKLKYYREAELYHNIIDYLIKSNFPSYTVEDFRFVVINDKILSPTVYKFPVIYDENNYLKIGNVKTVRPISAVIDDIIWHRKIEEYSYDRSLYEKMLLCMNEGNEDEHPEISII